MNRREFLTRAVETGLALGLPSILLAACDESSSPSPAEKNPAGKYYPEGVLNQNIEVEGLCNIWMAGERLNPRQASGLPVNGETYAIATWRFSMGSRVTVTDLDTGKSVEAVVTDRGPNEIAYPGHICDITPLVAREIAGGKTHDIRIRLSPGSSAPSVQSSTPANQSEQNTSGVCVSRFKSSVTRKINEPPHPGDNSRCVAGPNGEPIWVPVR